MAGVTPQRTIPGNEQVLPRARTLPTIHRREWLALLAVALVTLAALILAYSARPAVRIDIGDYYDSIFLASDGDAAFHDREAGAISGGMSSPWPQDSQTLELPGNLSGPWIATLTTTAEQPDDVLKPLALTVNGTRIGIVRRTPRSFVALIPPEITSADQLSLELTSAVADGPQPPLNVVGSAELAPAETYRWSRGASEIRLPNIGRGDWQVTLKALVAHPDDAPVGATVAANGTVLAQLPDRRELRDLRLFVPAALVPNGDLTLTIAAQTYNDPRPLGVLVEGLSVTPAGGTPLAPPLGALLSGLALGFGAYLTLRLASGRIWPALIATVVIVLGLAWALAATRFPTALLLPRLAALALWSLALLWLLHKLVVWAFRRAGVPISPWLLRGLLLVFFAGYWLKAGGMLFPYFVGIDVSWHMARVQWILDGQLPLLYGTNSPLNESTMPAAEWGANRPVIPYSPWFHIFATSFALVPLPMVLTAHMVSALLDCSRVFLIALLGRKVALTERESFFAALLYAITPATFLLLSWGNIPTTSGLWWALLCTVYIITVYDHLDKRRPFLILTGMLTVTFLIYTVIGVFTGLFLALLIAALLLVAPKGQRRPAIALGLATLAAAALATVIYYGQYIPLMVERTLPYLTQAAAPGQGIEGVKYDPFSLYLVKYLWRMDYFTDRGGGYGLLLTVPLGLLGWFWIRGRVARTVLLCWLLVAILFTIAGARVSMVDKHLFYLIPALALGVGALFGRLWDRGLPARIVTISLLVFTAAAAINLWIYRIATVRQ